MANQDSPLNFVLREISETHNRGLFYASVSIALTIPDICSALEFETGDEMFWKNQKRYERWCETYLAGKLSQLTPQDIWALRGGVIHRGQTFGHPKARFERVVFILPDRGGNSFQVQSTMKDSLLPVLSISVTTFCDAIVKGAFEWIAATSSNAIVQANAPGLIRFRPQGYENHVVGMPVIA